MCVGGVCEWNVVTLTVLSLDVLCPVRCVLYVPVLSAVVVGGRDTVPFFLDF